jgi:hypothetical protein
MTAEEYLNRLHSAGFSAMFASLVERSPGKSSPWQPTRGLAARLRLNYSEPAKGRPASVFISLGGPRALRVAGGASKQ